MQTWKIKRMSTRRINQWLSAIGKLLKHYEGKVRVKGCPLCDMVDVGMGCLPCLWEVIEGIHCKAFAQKLYGKNADAGNCRNGLKRYKRWRVARIGQLKNWKKIFKLELARRFE